MSESNATRSIIDTHRHIFGPKLRQKFIENLGFDDSKPLPQANAGEMFFYRESLDVDYSMEIQRQSGVTLCVNSYGGEIETFAQQVVKASTIDTLKFLHDESFGLRDRFPKEIAYMANAHALEENTRDVIDPLISNKEACCISISTSYGSITMYSKLISNRPLMSPYPHTGGLEPVVARAPAEKSTRT